MKCEIIPIKTKAKTKADIHTYFPDNYDEIDSSRTRPLVLICPGGGYAFTSDREAEAVALRFVAQGYHACVLKYSAAPARFPQALCELSWSVHYLRNHAHEYGIMPDKIFVTGFSAGGHLAASLGVFWHEQWLEQETGLPSDSIRPNGLILCYPVISFGTYGHEISFNNLTGNDNTAQQREYLSLEKQITKKVPPVFIWHTDTDDSVPVQNTLLFINELKRAGVSMEVHIFSRGPHALSLANEETMVKENGSGIQKRCQIWIDLAGAWIQDFIMEG